MLSAVLIVVIRYFGGTKLGVGPLGKAYYTAAEMVLNKSEIITKTAYAEIEIKVDFNLVSQLHRILLKFSAKIIKTDYFNTVNFTCLVPPLHVEELKKYVSEVSKGSADVKISDKTLFL